MYYFTMKYLICNLCFDEFPDTYEVECGVCNKSICMGCSVNIKNIKNQENIKNNCLCYSCIKTNIK